MAGDGCGCLTHDGSHAEHIDRLDRERNAELLRTGLDETVDPFRRDLALRGFVIEERARLQRKIFELRRK